MGVCGCGVGFCGNTARCGCGFSRLRIVSWACGGFVNVTGAGGDSFVRVIGGGSVWSGWGKRLGTLPVRRQVRMKCWKLNLIL